MSTTVCSSNNKLLNQNYDIITKVLIYKQLNPPQYRVYKFDRGYLGTVLSKSVSLIFDVQGRKIDQFFVYDINNKIVKYRQYYVSEEKKKQNMEKNRMRKKMKRLTHFLI
jgi:hypothetical protein